jgi:hypothetical protein
MAACVMALQQLNWLYWPRSCDPLLRVHVHGYKPLVEIGFPSVQAQLRGLWRWARAGQRRHEQLLTAQQQHPYIQHTAHVYI